MLTKEQNVLLRLTATGLSGDLRYLPLSDEELTGVQWESVLNEALAQTLPMLSFQAAKAYEAYIPKETFARWRNVFYQAYQTNAHVWQAQANLVEIMREGKFPYIVLKGEVSASYYPQPELRALGDVDFLIDTRYQSEIEEALTEKSYARDPAAHNCHICFDKPNEHLEMHYRVLGIPTGEKGERVRSFLQNAVAEGVEKQGGLTTFNAPSDERHGLIMLLHMQHHNLSEGLGLRHLCDWAAYVRRTDGSPFWEEKLLPLLRAIGMIKYASVVTKMSELYLGVPCPVWAKNTDETLCAALLDDMFSGGNFGRKDGTRSGSSWMIAQDGDKQRGTVAALATTLHRIVLLQYPIVKKVWILYPFIYVGKVIKNLFQMLTGKKPTLGKLAPTAKRRRELYTKLEIFQSMEDD